ncbi:hypothetical protein [Natronococcus occultus]|uniref:Uncharacterized protein n=1 Tax=Natronococcus occultus SP4 TaxID=694430 RepID=L0K2R7_9EURY|nr:hypothetical protein [Natronococcus occultus]AGB38659.1 hypothetical protein Natoc_2903 [Natronococcus occultus SP4]
MTDQFSLLGVYVSPPVADALSEAAYEAAGVVDLEDYFAESTGTVPAGDPGAEATDELLADVLDEFPALYDAADFDAAAGLEPDAFELVRLAATPDRAAQVRERFRAAATVRGTDLRTVQTAILAASLSVDPSE